MTSGTPLFDALRAHLALGRSSFHTPGHKGAPGFFPDRLEAFDLTELPDTDSLFEAEGAILEAERAAARLFGTARTLFSAGGCTLCIQAMLRLAVPEGGEILSGRIIHRSAVQTMALLDLKPHWVMPRPDAGEGLPGRVWAEDVCAALRAHPGIRAVYLTSPDYYGVLADLPAIAEVCREHGVPLLVDNAHGAHLGFVGGGLHPVARGASMAACSAHKTLPVLTGGAYLNIADGRFAPEAKAAMALFGSTSPSYPVLLSLDLCRAWLEREGRTAFARLEERVCSLREFARSLGLGLPAGLCDPVRLTLRTADIGLTGVEAAERFRSMGVEPEYADGAFVVLLPTPMNGEEDFARLEGALRALPRGKGIRARGICVPPPVPVLTPRQALFASSEPLPLEQAVGRVAAETACPCPPGVPVVMPGEKITREAAEFLSGYGIRGLPVVK